MVGSKTNIVKLLLGIAMVTSLVAAVACAGAKTETPAAKPPPVAAIGAATNGAAVGQPYVAKPQVEGEFWSYQYDGTAPTTFREAPMLAELVKQGKLPPLEQRLPSPEYVRVIPTPEGIGDYGGTWRITDRRLWRMAGAGGEWAIAEPDGVTYVPNVGFWEISDDGRVYTLTMRKGLKWSDGKPFTMEDIRFAFEDLWEKEWRDPGSGRKEFIAVVQTEYIDRVTGDKVEFDVVDDHTFTLTYDTPMYTMFDGRLSRDDSCGGNSWMCPKHYMAPFHPKYGDHDEIKRLIDENPSLHGWRELFQSKGSRRTSVGRPTLGAWVLESDSDLERTVVRNPYFWQVDPEGNQLPYVDRIRNVKVESREVAVFRGLRGESDATATPYIVREMPIYLANQERLDYRIFRWTSSGGSDANITFQMDWNDDPEVAKWVRTKEFRRALNLAVNRNSVNETLFLGMGVPRNDIPHPSTSYYPGPEYETLETEYDPAKANQMLDALGLTARDAEGFRLRADGSGRRLVLEALVNVDGPDFVELIVSMWADVGIQLRFRTNAFYYLPIRANKAYLSITCCGSGRGIANPWYIYWGHLAPMSHANHIATEVGKYAETGGEQGMAPNGPDPKYLPLSPKGTYPSDVSGNLMKLQNLWNEGTQYPAASPDRARVAQEIYKIQIEEKYRLSTVAFTTSGSILIAQNNFRNLPKVHASHAWGSINWSYYFVDGQDNIEKR